MFLLSFKFVGDKEHGFPNYRAKLMTWEATIQYIPECLCISLIASCIIFIIFYFYEVEQQKYIKSINQNTKIIEDIYIPLLDNESYRPVPAICITETMYKLQGEDLYKELNENWQFLPGDTVLVEHQYIGRLYCLVAVEKVADNDYLCTSKSDTNEIS
jgi:hypothetical protein